MSYVQDLDEEVQFLIAARGIPLQVAPGHELCAQGDAADCVWLLHEGMGAFCSCVTHAYAADCVWLLHEGVGALLLYHTCTCS